MAMIAVASCMLHSCNKYDRNVLLISIRDSEHDNMLCQKVQGWVLGGRRILGYTVSHGCGHCGHWLCHCHCYKLSTLLTEENTHLETQYCVLKYFA